MSIYEADGESEVHRQGCKITMAQKFRVSVTALKLETLYCKYYLYMVPENDHRYSQPLFYCTNHTPTPLPGQHLSPSAAPVLVQARQKEEGRSLEEAAAVYSSHSAHDQPPCSSFRLP